MTQIIFQATAICCCIYTAYRLGLLIMKKLRNDNKTRKTVRATPSEISGETEPASGPDRIFPSSIKELVNIARSEHLSYRVTYLANYPVGNRVQVYINRDSYAFIKRFLAVVSPDTSLSGFISRIVDEHLKKHENEMSELYTECITKPL